MATTKKASPQKVAPPKRKVSPQPKVNLAESALSHLAETFIINGDAIGLETLQESIKTVGYAIGDPFKKKKLPSFVLPENLDGATYTSGSHGGGVYGSYIDLGNVSQNEIELIGRYREMSAQPEVDFAIQDIINESIVVEDEKRIPIAVDLDELNDTPTLKETIHTEFQQVLKLLNFKRKGQQIFKKWYVDGRLYYHMVIDPANPQAGIQELRYIDPRRIKKVREINKTLDPKTGSEVNDVISEYYVYNSRGIIANMASATGQKIAPDCICYCHSGLVDPNKNVVYSHLHKAIKPLNQLRYMEDATVIYRVSRAPERRIFYVDVGTMPAAKAQAYLNDVMNRYRNKLIYDSATGEIRDDKKFLSMMEDYWIPRKNGSTGTQVDTLKGGENLGKLEDVEYFEKKLYQSLNVPISRLQSDSGGFNMGRESEISRDEEKFYKFVVSLRNEFAELFFIILGTQLRLKGIIDDEEWIDLKERLVLHFAQNSYHTETSELQILNTRLESATAMLPLLGVVFPYRYILKEIFKKSDDEIAQLQAEMAQETPRMSYDMQNQLVLLQSEAAAKAANAPPKSKTK